MARRQHATPVLIESGKAQPLHRVPFGDRGYDEKWLQSLLFKHPSLLPVEEMEPLFEGLVPVCRELPTRSGPVDLLFANAAGHLTIVETKLWRNPEARRNVVGQLIDYTKDIAKWSYTDLVGAIRTARGDSPNDPLVSLLQNDEDFEETTFSDQVSRNLRLGRFLLLIVGDGIHEDVEHMVDFLQKTPQLQFTLGLVEIALFRTNPDKPEPLFVQSRVVARTAEVTRAVVEIKTTVVPTDIVVTLPDAPDLTIGGASRRRLTEESFLDELAALGDKSAVELARWVLDHAADYGIDIKWGSGGPLLRYLDDELGHFTFGQLSRHGKLASTLRLIPRLQREGLPIEIGKDYLDEVARLLPGVVRKAFKTAGGAEYDQLVSGDHGRFDDPPLSLVAQHRDEWVAIMVRTAARIRKAIEERAE